MYQQDPSSELAQATPCAQRDPGCETRYERAALLGTARVIATADGEILFSSPTARSILRQHCPSSEGALPRGMVNWLRSGPSPGQRFSLLIPGSELIAEHRSWLNEQTLEPLPALSGNRSPRRLALLSLVEQSVTTIQQRLHGVANLTSREAEILAWVAFGKTSGEIAAICNVSSRTVQKHMEHLFQKLDVCSRTAALALVWSRISGS